MVETAKLGATRVDEPLNTDQTIRLAVAVPGLHQYQSQPGIARSFRSLERCWGQQVRLVDASYESFNLPVLRNFPRRVRTRVAADLILLPKMTGSIALRKTNGLPSLVVVHDLGVADFAGDRERLDYLTYQIAMQNVHSLKYADHIITVSRFTQDRLLHHLPSLDGRVTVVLNGVQTIFHTYRRNKRDALQHVQREVGRSLGGPLMLYVGTEIPRKNTPLLLRVFKKFKQIEPSAQLLKVGGAGHSYWRGRTLKLLDELKLRIGEDVILLDQINDELLADLYRSADVFVSTSRYEGFGLPFAEAMAMGTPVVVADCGAARETVGDIGWVVEPEIEPFVRAITAAIDAPPARLRGGQERAAIFTWERAADQYLEIMRQMMI